MPDHADLAIVRLSGRPRRSAEGRLRLRGATPFGVQSGCGAQGLHERDGDRVELVIPRHLLDQRAAAHVLEDDEVADEVEESALLEALDHDLQLRECVVRRLRSLDRPPGHEPLTAGPHGADARLCAVRDYEHLVIRAG